MGKPRLTLMVGLPASGKSTYARVLGEADNTTVLSSDILRKELLGSEADQSNNDLVFKTLYERARALLKDGKNVVIDATNINAKDRKRTLSNFSDLHIERFCYVMSTPVDVCIERDKNRDRTVGENIINKFLCRFEIPMYFEGFDEIAILQYAEKDKETTREKLFDLMKVFNQDNPHHKFTLDKHCEETAKFVAKHTIDKELIEIAKLHDIGKLLTKSFDDGGVAHYYSHHNVGAYMLMSAQLFVPFTLHQIFLVNYHMNPFMWKEEKTKVKYMKLLGPELYNQLMLLHECDQLASNEEA